MALLRPILDDMSYQQLRDDCIQRVPVFNPEWTNHNASDPGITLIECFSVIGENLLFRFNQLPETAYIEFLDLLQMKRRPPGPARALITVGNDSLAFPLIEKGSTAKAGNTLFQTQVEVRALPLTGIAVCKAAAQCPNEVEDPEIFEFFRRTVDAIDGLAEGEEPACYVNDILSGDGHSAGVAFANAVDGMMWLAVLNASDAEHETLRAQILRHEDGPLLLNVGFLPDAAPLPFPETPACPGEGLEDSGPPVEWQISTGAVANDGSPVYRRLKILGDTTRGLTREGVMRLELPRGEEGMAPFAVADLDVAGTGELPPRLDEETEEKILFWLRAYRPDGSRFGTVRLLDINATEVEQKVEAHTEFLGTGNGQPGQTFRLSNIPVIPGSLRLEVEGPDGWEPWQEVDAFHASTESDRHFVVHHADGIVKTGTGLQGYLPQIGCRVRAVSYESGGGSDGNVAAEAISKIERFPSLKPANKHPAAFGYDGETLEEALNRIPGEIRRRDRAVTRGDFRELALMTPGVDVGRAECLPLFRPQTPERDVPGAVSVMVWPREDRSHPNAPMPDQRTLDAVCRWLDARRLITTELYVVPPVYRKIAVSIGLRIKPGYGIEAVRHWVELVVRQFLAPLPEFGPSGEGWPLGRRVHGPELEAAALQVEGVEYLEGLTLAGWDDGNEKWVPAVTVELEPFEVPELAEITALNGPPLDDPSVGIAPPPQRTAVPIPIIREEC